MTRFPRRFRRRIRAVVVAISTLAALQPVHAVEPTLFPALGAARASLSIYAATDLAVIEPLIRDFQLTAPEVAVEVRDYQTNDLFAQALRDCAGKRATGDVLISSSVDQLVKLANDGCARAHQSPHTAALPEWRRWRDEVFGFTFEPAVMAYNPSLTPAHEAPRTRVELIELLRAKPERYEGRIASYDIERAGIGYLFAFNDARNNAIYGRLIEGFGRAKLRALPTTSEIVSAIASGEILIGYNLLGSYVQAAIRRHGAPVAIIVPSDYTLVLSRGVMISAATTNSSVAAQFLDYLLSTRGQRIAREASLIFDAGDAVDANAASFPSVFRPITIGPELLVVQDRAKRERFLSEWRRSTAGGFRFGAAVNRATR